jgi:hypothetical protein
VFQFKYFKFKKCNNEKNVMMIVNPISGAIDKSDFVLATQRFSHQENFNFVSYETSGIDDASLKLEHFLTSTNQSELSLQVVTLS